ncbi:MAG TPA: TonB-dependent receptor [Pyrinomonadaceae bacterium]|nr:TonB-dependent receptor [Pyrinomonadaceae bacterium]
MLLKFLPPVIAEIVVVCCCLSVAGQSQTNGAIAGIVTDETGAVIPKARIVVRNRSTAALRKTTTDATGTFTLPFLAPGNYEITIEASGFARAVVRDVTIAITETTRVEVELSVATISQHVEVSTTLLTTGPQLGRVIEARAISDLPLATRNFTQLLALSPGSDAALADNTGVGRNSQNISVNGARRTQNNFRINGVDANTTGTNSALFIAVPAPETIEEFKVQTSLYDASFGRAGGGNLQALTKSGTSSVHGTVYTQFRISALNANNPFLKASRVERPPLARTVVGATVGGPARGNRAFYFLSYQETRERNGLSVNSLSSNVLVASGLTNDRSESALKTAFGLPAIHPVSLALLNFKMQSGAFLIPTPQPGARYSGSTISSYSEHQFNVNFDFRLNERGWLTTKFFFANAPSTLAMFNGPNVPGFNDQRQLNHRLVAIQLLNTFGSSTTNEAHLGYSFVRNNSFPDEPLRDAQFGIRRSNADAFPGFPLIRIAPTARGIAFGTGFANIDLQAQHHAATAGDVLVVVRGKHVFRAGAELVWYRVPLRLNFFRHGQIDFATFNDFLRGAPSASFLGSGIHERDLQTTDYSAFFQDDWRLSRRLTLNLGMRYELSMPFADTRGRLSTFDPALYGPRFDIRGQPVGPPAGGFVQARNALPQYDLAQVPNVEKRLVKTLDPNNFGPRVGFAFFPTILPGIVVRGGYGIFYSRISTGALNNIQTPPTYLVGTRVSAALSLLTFDDPFFPVPQTEQFPLFVTGATLTGQFLDRNVRTPYIQQYNTSVQYRIGNRKLLEIAYVGTGGASLPRLVAINQARLASPQRPVINSATGALVVTNTPQNAQLRAPFQGVSIVNFTQAQTTAQSTYNSFQMSFSGAHAHGSFLASYTFAKAIDNASGRDEFDFSSIVGDQLDDRANRGVSDFDRRHRIVVSCVWELTRHRSARDSLTRRLLSDWQIAGILVAMSGQPIDIVDTGAGSFYGLNNGPNPLVRPSWAPGATRRTATTNVPSGYFFNPLAFFRPVVTAGQPIPSSNGLATADALGTDIGNVGRNVLRGPRQVDLDFSIARRFPFADTKNIELRAEFFNLFNRVNLSNPISDLNAVVATGSLDPLSGRILNPGDFGRITSTSNNPRLIQFAAKLNF